MKKRNKKIIIASSLIIVALTLTGCAKLNDWFSKATENLVGKHYVITSYDDYANKVLTVEGTKINLSLLENDANFDTSDSGFKSEVLEITINGDQIFQVGNTLVIAEDGLDQIEDYDVPENIETSSGGSFISIDRAINSIANEIGKEKVIIISSQMGIPIGVYQGDDVYVTIPDDLPKTTRINIDGKVLYIHRANYTILDADLIN